MERQSTNGGGSSSASDLEEVALAFFQGRPRDEIVREAPVAAIAAGQVEMLEALVSLIACGVEPPAIRARFDWGDEDFDACFAEVRRHLGRWRTRWRAQQCVRDRAIVGPPEPSAGGADGTDRSPTALEVLEYWTGRW